MEVVVLRPVDAGPLEPFFAGEGEEGRGVVVGEFGVAPKFVGSGAQTVEAAVAVLEHL